MEFRLLMDSFEVVSHVKDGTVGRLSVESVTSIWKLFIDLSKSFPNISFIANTKTLSPSIGRDQFRTFQHLQTCWINLSPLCGPPWPKHTNQSKFPTSCVSSRLRIQSKSPPKTPWKQQKIVESPKPEETFHEWKKIRFVDEKKS